MELQSQSTTTQQQHKAYTNSKIVVSPVHDTTKVTVRDNTDKLVDLLKTTEALDRFIAQAVNNDRAKVDLQNIITKINAREVGITTLSNLTVTDTARNNLSNLSAINRAELNVMTAIDAAKADSNAEAQIVVAVQQFLLEVAIQLDADIRAASSDSTTDSTTNNTTVWATYSVYGIPVTNAMVDVMLNMVFSLLNNISANALTLLRESLDQKNSAFGKNNTAIVAGIFAEAKQAQDKSIQAAITDGSGSIVLGLGSGYHGFANAKAATMGLENISKQNAQYAAKAAKATKAGGGELDTLQRQTENISTTAAATAATAAATAATAAAGGAVAAVHTEINIISNEYATTGAAITANVTEANAALERVNLGTGENPDGTFLGRIRNGRSNSDQLNDLLQPSGHIGSIATTLEDRMARPDTDITDVTNAYQAFDNAKTAVTTNWTPFPNPAPAPAGAPAAALALHEEAFNQMLADGTTIVQSGTTTYTLMLQNPNIIPATATTPGYAAHVLRPVYNNAGGAGYRAPDRLVMTASNTTTGAPVQMTPSAAAASYTINLQGRAVAGVPNVLPSLITLTNDPIYKINNRTLIQNTSTNRATAATAAATAATAAGGRRAVAGAARAGAAATATQALAAPAPAGTAPALNEEELLTTKIVKVNKYATTRTAAADALSQFVKAPNGFQDQGGSFTIALNNEKAVVAAAQGKYTASGLVAEGGTRGIHGATSIEAGILKAQAAVNAAMQSLMQFLKELTSNKASIGNDLSQAVSALLQTCGKTFNELCQAMNTASNARGG